MFNGYDQLANVFRAEAIREASLNCIARWLAGKSQTKNLAQLSMELYNIDMIWMEQNGEELPDEMPDDMRILARGARG